uniref:Uncharacterized protein n=1 Tax=Glossina pallidipes TaxID=7398 RepID=A0A1B0A2X0_GLOPL
MTRNLNNAFESRHGIMPHFLYSGYIARNSSCKRQLPNDVILRSPEVCIEHYSEFESVYEICKLKTYYNFLNLSQRIKYEEEIEKNKIIFLSNSGKPGSYEVCMKCIYITSQLSLIFAFKFFLFCVRMSMTKMQYVHCDLLAITLSHNQTMPSNKKISDTFVSLI